METATFAAGCFWGVEDLFRKHKGVTSTQVGYTGGKTKNPTYEDVCYKNTGHTEAVEITFDPSVISYGELLKEFWSLHDPTQKNRQGPDIGSQYRSAIFYHNEMQKKQAISSVKEEQKKYSQPITTQIVPADTFWRAEEYHQQYFEKHQGLRSCHIRR